MNSGKLTFISEIESMMHGFGDVQNPKRAAAEILEATVKTELRKALKKAEEASELRMSGKVDLEEIVFLLRCNKYKLRRVYRCLVTRALGSKFESEEGTETDVEQIASKKERYVKRFKDFLKLIDVSEELLEFCELEVEPDEARLEKLERMDRLSWDMEASKYEAFAKARSVKFCNRGRGVQKFVQWLAGPTVATKVTEVAWEIIQFLAYELIGDIMDMVFLHRRNQYTSDTGQLRLPALTANPGFPAVYTNNVGLSSAGTLGSPVQPEEIFEAHRRLSCVVSPFGNREMFSKLVAI